MRYRIQWVAPFLTALHFPLFLFADNVAFMRIRETYGAVGASLLLTALMLTAVHVVTRDRARSVAIATGLWAWCSWYGMFSNVLGTPFGVGAGAVRAASLLLVPWTVLWMCYVVAMARARSPEFWARYCLVASVALIAQSLVVLGVFMAYRPPAAPPTPTPVALRVPSTPPDMFFVIFDQYASNTTMHKRYRFDNSGIVEALRARGFFVAERSQANYFKTGLSLAATLNHTHLIHRFEGFEAISDWRPLYRFLEDHRVWQALKPLGYDYVHMGSYWEPTRQNPHASANLSYSPVPFFAHSLYMRTPLHALGLSMGGLFDMRQEQWNRIHRQLEDLEKIRTRPRPLFVFVHFLLPHAIRVFGPNGEFLPAEAFANLTRERAYVSHVRFANVAMLRLIDAVLADTARPRPIIIVQADEGPYPLRYATDQRSFDWRRATADELRQKFGILNAMYLPGVAARGLHPAISPVNTFRIVFNEYFGTDLELLPDRSWVSVGDTKPYHFIDVTDIVNGD